MEKEKGKELSHKHLIWLAIAVAVIGAGLFIHHKLKMSGAPAAATPATAAGTTHNALGPMTQVPPKTYGIHEAGSQLFVVIKAFSLDNGNGTASVAHIGDSIWGKIVGSSLGGVMQDPSLRVRVQASLDQLGGSPYAKIDNPYSFVKAAGTTTGTHRGGGGGRGTGNAPGPQKVQGGW